MLIFGWHIGRYSRTKLVYHEAVTHGKLRQYSWEDVEFVIGKKSRNEDVRLP